MSSLISRLSVLGFLSFLAILLLAVYETQIAQLNEYMGYRIFAVDVVYIVSSVLAIFIVGLLIPVVIRRPSDFFILIYALFILLPYAVLYPIRGAVELHIFIANFFILAMPFLTVSIVAKILPSLRVPVFFTPRTLVNLLVMLCLVGVSLALLDPPASAGFSMDNSYERRLQGRDIYSTGTFLAYLIAAIVNGFAPFLAFYAAWQKKVWLLMLSFFCGAAFFYLLGLKAPILFIAVALVLGYLTRREQIDLMIKAIYFLLAAAFMFCIVEFFFYEYSYVADYFIRRAFTVPPWLIAAYFEFMATSSTPAWQSLQGVSSVEPISMIVGEVFLGFPDLNANTNAFIYQLAAGGIPLYVLTILLVSFVYAVLDATYKCRRNPALIFLGFSYAILLTEQAATTALVSSGIGTLIFLAVFSGAGGRVIARASKRDELIVT
ncbi:hypothetical protein [Pseudomonas leptonychotis]|uniref:hypothetical protein n=1 Tax=Pseudomonas leptonychotis TaxID=2448482 RepID=UPI003867DFEC